MYFDRMTVGQRLYIGFGLILAVLIGVTALAMLKVHTINQALRANSETAVVVQRHAINFRGSAHDRSIAVRDLVLAGSAAERQKELAAIERLGAFYAASATPLDAMMSAPDAEPQMKPLYAAIQAIEQQAVSTSNRIIDLVGQNDTAAAQSLLWNQAKPQYEQWLSAINRLIDFQEARLQANNNLALKEAGGFVAVMLTSLAMSLMVGGVLAWSISRSILRQLGAEPSVLSDAARQVAGGNLQPVSGAAQAFGGSVMSSLGLMQQSLSRVVGLVRHASDSIATGSSEIASGNADLSARTETQASNLQQTAASMQQLSQTVQTNADTAMQANQMAASASAAAEK
ncbi:MAG TPA: MCP four helix bundle domain-containing protein, partial [Rubrivivax sp.]|nr:MCP four helix bundle domain-containing protein [Rubrivivax sp.]